MVSSAQLVSLGYRSLPATDLGGECARARLHFFDVVHDIAGGSEIARIVPSLQFCLIGPEFSAAAARVNAARHHEFRAIGEAILAGDPEGSERAMRVHVGRTLTVLRDVPALCDDAT